MLQDREAETLRAWLVAHPGVEIISRDRASAYADGARKGAPQAIQIADRWHLLKNLRDAVERLLLRNHALLKQAFEQVSQSTKQPLAEPEQPSPEIPMAKPLPRAEQDRCQRRERRQTRYQAVRDLHAQGTFIRAIAKQLGIHRRTVRLFIGAESFPERAAPPKRFRKTDQFFSYLQQRWEAGCHNATQLYSELQKQGFAGSASTVRRAVSRWRDSNSSAATTVKAKPASPRKTFWLLTEKLKEPTAEEQEYAQKLTASSPEIETAQKLAREFFTIIQERKVTELEAWMETARNSKVPELQGFIQGLNKDLEAVKAALSYEWSNGQTEGQVNRLKTLKRQMYGRAKFDLLRARVLQTV